MTAGRLITHEPWDATDRLTDLTDHWGTIPTPSPEQVHAARLQVCGMAEDAEDARELLLMLGLLP